MKYSLELTNDTDKGIIPGQWNFPTHIDTTDEGEHVSHIEK